MNHSINGKPLKMPPREPDDGDVSVKRLPNEFLVLTAVSGGDQQSVLLSPYNAWRAFGMLALFLGISLPAALGKLIKFGDGLKADIR